MFKTKMLNSMQQINYCYICSFTLLSDIDNRKLLSVVCQVLLYLNCNTFSIFAWVVRYLFFGIHVQYSYIMRFLVRHNRHHKVSKSVPLFKSCKTVTIFLRIKVGGHFVMSIVKCHESHYVGVLDNPLLRATNLLIFTKTSRVVNFLVICDNRTTAHFEHCVHI